MGVIERIRYICFLFPLSLSLSLWPFLPLEYIVLICNEFLFSSERTMIFVHHQTVHLKVALPRKDKSYNSEKNNQEQKVILCFFLSSPKSIIIPHRIFPPLFLVDIARLLLLCVGRVGFSRCKTIRQRKERRTRWLTFSYMCFEMSSVGTWL